MHSMTRPLTLATAASTVLLAACGKTEAPPSPARQAARTAGDERSLSAEQVAKEARGQRTCPPKPTAPTPVQGMQGTPVDDVLGVRPGMAYDQAMDAVLCAHDLLVATPATGRGFDIKAPQAHTVRQGFTARTAEPRLAKTGKQLVKDMQDDSMARGGNAVREDLKPGQSKWFVATMGLPGQERVLGVAREERFALEQSPTVETVQAALVKKYGTPTFEQPRSDTRLPLARWAYDPQGRPITPGSPLFARCVGTSDPNGSMQVVPECGVVVQAMLIPQQSNPALVDRMQVGVVNQSAGYRLLSDTEQCLLRLDQRRRAQEVDQAAKNGKSPTL